MPRVQNKRGTAANLASVDPTPAAGEIIWESDTNRLKVGNGSDAYTSLAYVGANSPTFTGQVTVAAGSVTAPAIAVGDADTGIYSPAENELAVSAAGVQIATFRRNPNTSGQTELTMVGSTRSIMYMAGGASSGAIGGFAFRNAVLTTTAIIYGTTTGTTSDAGGAITFETKPESGSITERMRIRSDGRVAIGTTSPTATLDVNADTMRLRTARTPASAAATGNAGDICWDSSYLYVCTATNTWRRIAHSTW